MGPRRERHQGAAGKTRTKEQTRSTTCGGSKGREGRRMGKAPLKGEDVTTEFEMQG